MKRILWKGWFLLLLMAAGLGFLSRSASAKTMILPAVGSYGQTEARSVYNMVNRFRASKDAWYWASGNNEKINVSGALHKLNYNYDLERAAMLRAMEIAVSYDYVRPNKDTCFTAYTIDACSMAENIAVGYGSASEVFDAWMETGENYEGQGQRRNMLSNEFNAVGIGHVVVNGVHYWVQAFAYTEEYSVSTSAVNGTKTVDLEVDSSMVKDIILAPEENTLSVTCGMSESLPAMKVYLVSCNSALRVPLDVSCRWKSLNPSVASISNGTVKGVREGKTTLVAAVYGKTLSIPVTVSKNTGGVEDNLPR